MDPDRDDGGPAFVTAAPAGAAATGAASTAAPFQPTKKRSKVPVIVGAAVVVVLLVVGIVALRGGGGGGGNGTGQVSGHLDSGKVFVRHIEVPKDSVLLVKVIPSGGLDAALLFASDPTTVEKHRTTFGGPGALDTANIDFFSGTDISPVKGQIFAASNLGIANQPEAAAQGFPFQASVDVVVSSVGGTSGDFTLQTALRTFVGPSTKSDSGFIYTQMLNTAYRDFLTGTADIADTTDFQHRSNFSTDSDFSIFSDAFSEIPD
jgi:hypothetical protein